LASGWELKGRLKVIFALLASWRDEENDSESSNLAQRRKGRQGKNQQRVMVNVE